MSNLLTVVYARLITTIVAMFFFAASFVPAAAADSDDLIWRAEEVAIAIIDYQPEQVGGVVTMDQNMMILNTRLMIRMAEALDIPVVLSTVGVATGKGPTVAEIKQELPDAIEIDRTSMNSWEDAAFVEAVEATGKKKIIFFGLWTEICLNLVVNDALGDGYEAAIILDAVGGTSKINHDTAITRMIQAGAVPMTTSTIATELFRDWGGEQAAAIKPAINWYFGEYMSLRASPDYQVESK